MEVDPRSIRRLRERKGWSQQDLARAASLSKPYISQLESGIRNPTPVVVKALARALDADVKDLHPLVATCPNCGTSFEV